MAFWFPLSGSFFSVGKLSGGHVAADLIPILCGKVSPFIISWVGCGNRVPHIGQHIISCHAVAEFIQPAQVVLRPCVSLGGRFFVPLSCHGEILRDPFPEVIAQPEVVLGAGMSLLGQWPPFAQGGGIVCALKGLYPLVIISPGGGSEPDDQEQQEDSEN